MKRALSIILSVLFLLTAMPLGMVSAATDAVIKGTVDKTTVPYGDTVTLSVYMENNPGLVCWAVDVVYDDAVFELMDQTAGDAYNGIGTLAFGPKDKNVCNVLWYDFLNPDVNNNGHLFSFTFKVKAGAAIGESSITLTTIDPANMLNAEFEEVEFNYESPAVEIVKCIHAYTPATTDPTCGAEGAIVYTCSICGDSYSESIPATGEHTYDNACDAECNGCDYVREVGEHVYSAECDETCNECGAIREAAEHTYESAITTAPACGAEGVMTYTCSVCGASYTEAIPATGEHAHTQEITTAPTCSAEGLATYTCPSCGDTYTEVIPATGDHVYDYECDAECNACGAIREAVAHLYKNADAPVCALCGDALDITAPIVYVTSNNPYVAAGDQVTVAVSMQQNPGLIGWQLMLNYDAAVLAPVEVIVADTFAGVEFGPVENVPFSAIWLDALNANVNANGVLYYVTFEVKADAAFGTTALSVALADEDSIFDSEMNTVAFAMAETGIKVLDHTHVYTADCDADCNECGFTRVPAEHIYESAVTTAPTCVDTGVLTYTCSACGDSYTEVIPATGEHTYESAVTTEATCVTEGVMTYTCSVCGASYTEAIPTNDNHTYESAVTTAPTCGAEGVLTYTCSACNASYTEAIPATGEHTYSYACDTVCDVCGYVREAIAHLYENADAPVCALCGEALNISAPIVYTTADPAYAVRGGKVTVAVAMQQNPGVVGWQLLLNYDADVLAPIEVIAADTFAGVEFGPVENVPFSAIWLDSLNGNVTANGVLYYVTFEVKADAAIGTTTLSVALVDEDSVFDNDLNAVSFALAASGINVQDHTHEYDNACDAECNVCGAIREVGEHTYESAVTTAPTCVDAGVMTYTCSACGDTYTEVIPATGEHTYESVVTAPTCVDKGYTTYTCSVCGDSYVADEVDALGHTYESAVTTAPTCGAEGVMTYTCSACGDTYTEAIPATGEHTYDGDYDADCNVCGAIREVSVMLGDVNGDGKFNVRDIGMLQQYMNGWAVEGMIEAAADVNCDGKINVRDIGLMQQVMNGWDNVAFGPQGK